MKSVFLKLAVGASLIASIQAQAYPVIDEAVPVGGHPIAVFRDEKNPKVFWYIPQSIEPWKRDNQHQSSLFHQGSTLSFIFRGQASVEDSMLIDVAKAIGTKPDNLMPITYDSSSNLVCQDIFVEEDRVSWKFPSMIGNYLEVVPVSIRTDNRAVVDELKYHLTHGGLACTVEVKFKGVTTGYRLKVVADFNKVYERFEAAAHAEGLWWEVDIHTMLERLRQERIITITSLEDETITQTELDKKIHAAADELLKAITTSMFNPALKLPQGNIANRGKAFSFRADYQRSQENNHVEFTLESNKVQLKSSQISLRLAVD